MIQTSRSLLYKTATALGLAGETGWSRGAVVPDALSVIAASAIAGGHSAGLALGYCLPIKSPAIAGFGQSNLETDAAVHGDTLFRIGACTRIFTASGILWLAEQGALKLHASARHYCADHFDSGNATLCDLLADISNDASYAALGAVITKVSGAAYVDFVTANLLIPAGMTSSLFHDPGRIIPNRASGYALRDGNRADFCHAPVDEAPIAAGGLWATAGDLLLWNRAFFNSRLISRDSVDRMTTSAASGPDILGALPCTSHVRDGYGLYVGRVCGRRAFWQRGTARGFDAWLFHFPDDRSDLVLLANTDDGAVPMIEPLVRAILRV